MKEVLGKRVKKRALALLEKMDRTEQGLYRKLAESEYPEELILDAIEYVKKYHYIDDMRFSKSYRSVSAASRHKVLCCLPNRREVSIFFAILVIL